MMASTSPIICEGCTYGDGKKLPDGIRLVPTPGTGEVYDDPEVREVRSGVGMNRV